MTGPPEIIAKRRTLSGRQVVFFASAVGLAGGLLATCYYFVLFALIHLIWSIVARMQPFSLSAAPALRPLLLIVTTTGGLMVGLARRRLGAPGEISAIVDNINLERGRIDIRQTPSMVVCSLLSIAFGGSAGPEAPLVQITGSAGSWFADKLHLRGEFVRSLTLAGMASSLAAFFGAPLGGALFALEIPHRRGLEYYEALLPSVLSGIIGFFVFRAFVSYRGPIYHLPAIQHPSLMTVAQGAGAGVIGAAVGAGFVLFFRLIGRVAEPLSHKPVLAGTLGGLGIGILAQFAPKTLFWSEFEIQYVLQSGPHLVAGHGRFIAFSLLLGLALAKMLSLSWTLHSGFVGGFIFPLFFIGASVGAAVSIALPNVAAPVAILCMMAAVNVAVTKTPISTTIILVALSGSAMMPAIAVASFTSFLLTTRVSMIRTQRSRIQQLNGVTDETN